MAPTIPCDGRWARSLEAALKAEAKADKTLDDGALKKVLKDNKHHDYFAAAVHVNNNRARHFCP